MSKNTPTFWGRSKNLTDRLRSVKRPKDILGSVKKLSDLFRVLFRSLKKIDRPYGVGEKILPTFSASEFIDPSQ